VRAREFLDSAIEEDEVVDQFEEAILLAELEQVLVQLEAGVILFVFLPVEEVFFLRAMVPYFRPSESLPAKTNWTVLKNH
jgi:hypothetical protein